MIRLKTLLVTEDHDPKLIMRFGQGLLQGFRGDFAKALSHAAAQKEMDPETRSGKNDFWDDVTRWLKSGGKAVTTEASWNKDQWTKAMDRVNQWKQANPALANAKRAAKEKENPQLRHQPPLPVKEVWPEPWKDSKTCARCGGPLAKMAPTAWDSIKMCPKCSKPSVPTKEATDPSSTFKVIDRPTPPLPDRYKWQAKPDDPAGRWIVVDGNGHPAGFWEYKTRSKDAMRKKAQAAADRWTAENAKQQARLATKNEARTARAAAQTTYVKKDGTTTCCNAYTTYDDGGEYCKKCKYPVRGRLNSAGEVMEASMQLKDALPDSVKSGFTKKALIRGPNGLHVNCPCGQEVPITGDRNVCKSCGTEFNQSGWIKNPKLEATGRPRPWDSPSQVAKKQLATKVVPDLTEAVSPKRDLLEIGETLDGCADQLEELDDRVQGNQDLLLKAVKHARFAYEYVKSLAEKY